MGILVNMILLFMFLGKCLESLITVLLNYKFHYLGGNCARQTVIYGLVFCLLLCFGQGISILIIDIGRGVLLDICHAKVYLVRCFKK